MENAMAQKVVNVAMTSVLEDAMVLAKNAAGLATPLFSLIVISVCYSFIARDSIYAKRAYAIAIPSVRLSVRPSVLPSVTRVIHAKMVVVRIVQFSPYSSPIPLVFAR